MLAAASAYTGKTVSRLYLLETDKSRRQVAKLFIYWRYHLNSYFGNGDQIEDNDVKEAKHKGVLSMNKPTMIKHLNEDLAGELGAIIQYLTYAAKVNGPYRPQLSQF